MILKDEEENPARGSVVCGKGNHWGTLPPGADTYVLTASSNDPSGTGLTWTSMSGPLNITQSAELTNTPVLTYTPYTPGNEPFQIQGNSWTNHSPGTGYNHTMHFGWNAGLFANGPYTPGMPSLYMGFEDNYYDYAVDLTYGVEWYVGYCTPDGTTIAPGNLRPFYTRVQNSNVNSAAKSVTTNLDIGSGPNGSFGVWGSIISDNQLFGITQTQAICYVPITLNAATTTTTTLTVGSTLTANSAIVVNPTGPSSIKINRIGTGTGNGQSWSLAISNEAGNDQMAMGWASSTYSTGGALAWVTNSQGFLYVPNALTIGTGVSSSGGIAAFSAAGFQVKGNVGFYGTTPVAQPATTGTTAGFTAGSGTNVLSGSSFTGNTGTTAYTISDIVRALKILGLLAS